MKMRQEWNRVLEWSCAMSVVRGSVVVRVAARGGMEMVRGGGERRWGGWGKARRRRRRKGDDLAPTD